GDRAGDAAGGDVLRAGGGRAGGGLDPGVRADVRRGRRGGDADGGVLRGGGVLGGGGRGVRRGGRGVPRGRRGVHGGGVPGAELRRERGGERVGDGDERSGGDLV